MKKFIFLLGLLMLAFLAAAPRAYATDNDIGKQIKLPAAFDYAQAPADYQAVDLTFESVTVIATRDPGSNYGELAPRLRSGFGLREESPAMFSSLSNGDLTDYTFFRNRQCTKAILVKSQSETPEVRSTSNGGIGY